MITELEQKSLPTVIDRRPALSFFGSHWKRKNLDIPANPGGSLPTMQRECVSRRCMQRRQYLLCFLFSVSVFCRGTSLRNRAGPVQGAKSFISFSCSDLSDWRNVRVHLGIYCIWRRVGTNDMLCLLTDCFSIAENMSASGVTSLIAGVAFKAPSCQRVVSRR